MFPLLVVAVVACPGANDNSLSKRLSTTSGKQNVTNFSNVELLQHQWAGAEAVLVVFATVAGIHVLLRVARATKCR